MNTPIKKIVIVGRDADAWLTALMLQQGFRSSKEPVVVELLELPSNLTKQDFFSVLPSHKTLHKMIGIRENLILQEAKGCYSFAQRFSNWSGNAAPYMHAYDRFGVDFDGVDFYQFWLRGASRGLKVPLEEFNLGAVAAKQGKYAVFEGGMTPSFSHAISGYNLDAMSYIQSIAKAALAIGVIHKSVNAVTVKICDGRIDAIVLSGGVSNVVEVKGDFYIDASGTEALLIKNLEQENLQNWSDWLPANRIIVATAPSLKPLPAFNQISAFKAGWIGIHPLLDRTAVNIVYSSKQATSKEALESALAVTGLKITDATEGSFSIGARKQHWIGNCLALGSSAVNLEPLDAIQLHFLHVGFSLLRALFPNDAFDMSEAEIYNEKIQGFIENARDFQIAHYHLNKRFDEPLWDDTRAMTIPQSLQEKIKLFEARGLLPQEEDETFQSESWTALLVGQQVKTKYYDPMVNKFSDDELIMTFQKILSHIKSEVEQMPSLQSQVEMTLL